MDESENFKYKIRLRALKEREDKKRKAKKKKVKRHRKRKDLSKLLQKWVGILKHSDKFQRKHYKIKGRPRGQKDNRVTLPNQNLKYDFESTQQYQSELLEYALKDRVSPTIMNQTENPSNKIPFYETTFKSQPPALKKNEIQMSKSKTNQPKKLTVEQKFNKTSITQAT